MSRGIVRYISQLVMLGMLLTLAVTLPVSAADLAIGSLTASCTDDGALVAWQVTTQSETEHPLVRVEWSVAGEDDWHTLGEGPLSASVGFAYAGTASASVEDESIDVRATAVSADAGGADWSDGRTAGDEVTVTLPIIDCVPPAVEVVEDGDPVDPVDPVGVEDTATGTGELDDPADTADTVDTGVEAEAGEDDPAPMPVVVDGGEAAQTEMGEPQPRTMAAPRARTTARAQCVIRDDAPLILVDVATDSTTPVTIDITIDGELRHSFDLADGQVIEDYPSTPGEHEVGVTADGRPVLGPGTSQGGWVLCPDNPDSELVEVTVSGVCDREAVMGLLTVSGRTVGRTAEIDIEIRQQGEPVTVDPDSMSLGRDDAQQLTFELPIGRYEVTVTAVGEPAPLHDGEHDLERDADGQLCEPPIPPRIVVSIGGLCNADTASYEADGDVTSSAAIEDHVVVIGGTEVGLAAGAADETVPFRTPLPGPGSFDWALQDGAGDVLESGTLDVAADPRCADVPNVPIVRASGTCQPLSDDLAESVVKLVLTNPSDHVVTFDVVLLGPDLELNPRVDVPLEVATIALEPGDELRETISTGLVFTRTDPRIIADIEVRPDDPSFPAFVQKGAQLDRYEDGTECLVVQAFSIGGKCDRTEREYFAAGSFEYPEDGSYEIGLQTQDGMVERSSTIGFVAAGSTANWRVPLPSDGWYTYQLLRDGEQIELDFILVDADQSCVITGASTTGAAALAGLLLAVGSGMVATTRRRRWS